DVNSLPIVSQVDTTNATTQPGEPLDCGGMGRTVWWGIRPTSRTTLQVDTSGSDFDTAIAIYRVPANFQDDISQLTRVSCAPGGPGVRSAWQQVLEPDAWYQVQVGGRGGAGGPLLVTIGCLPACPPPNDNAAAAGYIYPPFDAIVMTGGATVEAGEPRPCGDVGATVWWRLRTDVDAKVNIATGGSDFPTVVGIFVSDGPSPPGAMRSIACDVSPGG